MISLPLAGVVLVARQRALRQAESAFYTALTGQAQWEGGWELSELGADPSQAGSAAGSDRVTIPFTGTDFALRVRRGAYRAYFWISVDGEPANRLPRNERGAYLVLSSPRYVPQVVTLPVAGGLEDGPHVAQIMADRGWDQWPLVGWRVSREPDTTLYRWALTGLGALGSACLIGAIWWKASEKREARGRKPGAYNTRHATRDVSYFLPILQFAPPLSLVAVLVVAGVFYFSPWLPLTLLSGLVLAALILLRLDLGLALVAVSAPFYLHPRPLFGKAFSMAEIATLLCLISWLVRQVDKRYVWQSEKREAGDKKREAGSRKRERRNLLRPASCILHRASSLDLAALFFVLIAIASTVVADFRHVALRELRVVILEPLFFYLMLRTTRLDDKVVWRIVDAFVVGAVFVALIGVAQYAMGVNVITAEQGFRRLRSVYGSPNNAALYLGRALPVLAAVALFAAARRRRVIYGLAVVPVALAILLSFSRGAILLGVPLSLLAIGLLAGRRWQRIVPLDPGRFRTVLWAALGAVALAVVVVIALLATPRFAGLLDPHSGTLFFRLHLWRASWMMFRDHPLLGVGPDNFLYQYRGRYILPDAWQEPHLSHAHNVLLSYATRLGILGLAAGIWFQVGFWRLALPLRQRRGPGTGRSTRDRDRRALALGSMGLMVNVLAHGLVDASYFFPDLALAFFLALGLVQWLQQVKRKT